MFKFEVYSKINNMKNVIKFVALFGILFISCTDQNKARNETCDSNSEVIAESVFSQISTSNYGISNVILNGNCLEITIGSSGCNAEQWQMNLYSTDAFYTVYPLQRAVKVELINNQACLAVFQKTKSFDLTPFRIEGQNQTTLNIEGWNEQIIYYY
jgi:hypothetical protein